MKASEVIRVLKRLGNPRKAKVSMWFFKTDKGAYGHGDLFYGVTVPEQRLIAREFRDLPLSEIQKLLAHRYHECRLTALIILVERFKRATEKEREKIYRFYLKNRGRVNNWDLVDVSASYIVGARLSDKKRDILYTLARSKNLWDRRIAIIATHAFIKRDDFSDTFAIARLQLSDTHDLMHKAVGWMLREVGKRSKPALVRFLRNHAGRMPRTALRYAIEHMGERERKGYLAIPRI